MRKIYLTLLVAFATFSASSHANPTGAEVVSGNATFAQPSADVLNVTNSRNAIINWQNFSIGSGQTTNFIQPDAASAVLNRVVSNSPSQIHGNLNSNGQVFLINQHGLLVGAEAQINTAGFFGSTLNITDADFLNGDLKFEGGGVGDISNQGYIHAGEGGNVVLIAPNIENGGVIEVDEGNVILAAGRSITITSLENSAIQFEVESSENQVVNLGSIIANNGAASLFAGSLTHSGVIEATGLVQNADGSISLVATDEIRVTDSAMLIADGDEGGSIRVQSQSGDLYFSGSASARGQTGTGGKIELLGDRVGLFGEASVDASGATGGGEVLIGGDYQGRGETQTARQTQVSRDSVIRADAIESGDGGKVIVWADDYTGFMGSASATGGADSGDGGFIEISGKENLGFDGWVDTSADNGEGGTVLFDPQDIIVSNTGGEPYTPQNGLFGNNQGNVTTISATSISTFLESQNVLLQAGNDIFILDRIDVNLSGNGVNLTLQAGRSISIQADILTDNASLNMFANERDLLGLFDLDRQLGAAIIDMQAGTRIATGTGIATIEMRDGLGKSNNTAGDIVLSNIFADSLTVSQVNIDGSGGISTQLTGDINAKTIDISSVGDIKVESDLDATTRITLTSNSDQNTTGEIFLVNAEIDAAASNVALTGNTHIDGSVDFSNIAQLDITSNLTVNTGATLELDNIAQLDIASNLVVNAGATLGLDDVASLVDADSTGTITNFGRVELESGSTNLTKGLDNFGQIDIQSGTELDLAANLINKADASITGGGKLRVGATGSLMLDTGSVTDVSTLHLNGGALVANQVNFARNFIWDGGTVSGTGLTTSGTTNLLDNGSLSTDWTNDGVVLWASNGTSNFSSSSNIINRGIFSIEVNSAGGNTIGLSDTSSGFSNRGYLVIDAGLDTVDFVLGPSWQNQSAAIAINSGTFRLGGAALTLDAGSSLQGNGVFAGSVVNTAGLVTGGSLNPFTGAASTGNLTIMGNYSQGPGASLMIKLDTTVNGLQNDVLNVVGGAFNATGNLTFAPINNASIVEIAMLIDQSFVPIVLDTGQTNIAAFTSLTIPDALNVSVSANGLFTITAASSALAQLSVELDNMLEAGEFSLKEYFRQIEVLRKALIEKQLEGETPTLVCI